jgi:hypothetical protein
MGPTTIPASQGTFSFRIANYLLFQKSQGFYARRSYQFNDPVDSQLFFLVAEIDHAGAFAQSLEAH